MENLVNAIFPGWSEDYVDISEDCWVFMNGVLDSGMHNPPKWVGSADSSVLSFVLPKNKFFSNCDIDHSFEIISSWYYDPDEDWECYRIKDLIKITVDGKECDLGKVNIENVKDSITEIAEAGWSPNWVYENNL